MIAAKTEFKNFNKDVVAKIERAKFKNIRHALATIRKYAVGSMVFKKGPSPAGTPPHAHKGRLRRAIRFEVDKRTGEGVVGPAWSAMESGGLPVWIARIHEKGGTYKVKFRRRGRDRVEGGGTREKIAEEEQKAVTWPARPYMEPALERAESRFAEDWRASIT